MVCAAFGDGTIKCWGENSNGQLGDGTLTSHRTPVAVAGLPGPASAVAAGAAHTCALAAGGSAWCWGSNWYGELGDGTTTDRPVPVPVSALEAGLTTVTAGGAHTCASLKEGQVKCWGNNVSGQLGDGTNRSRSLPAEVVGLPPPPTVEPTPMPVPSPTSPAPASPACGSLAIGLLATRFLKKLQHASVHFLRLVEA